MADGYSFALTETDVDQVTQQADEFQKSYREGGGQGDWPMSVFLPDGHHTFRVYPDRDARGFARLIRHATMHNPFPINDKGETVRCWADPRVDKILQDAENEGLVTIRIGDKDRKVWMMKSREIGIMCVHWIESSEPKTIPVGSTCLAILDKRQMFEFSNFIASQHPEDKRKLIDPNLDAPGIKFSITKGAGKANVSVGISGMRNFKLPLPPMMLRNDKEAEIPFTSLDQLYITEEAQITNEQVEEFDRYIRDKVTKARASGSLAKNTTGKGFKFGDKQQDGALPNGGGDDKGPGKAPDALPGPDRVQEASKQETALSKLPDRSEALPAPKDPETGQRGCPLADKIEQMPSKAEEFGTEVRFGNRPGKSNPYCSICDNEDDCTAATMANRAAKAA